MSSQLGKIFKITTFGESHGHQVGVVIDGCPAGLNIDFSKIQQKLDRRKPGQSPWTSPRKEEDKIKCISGLSGTTTLGSPITLVTDNKDAKPQEYKDINKILRPSHADFTVREKYGFQAPSGGGRLSARETWARVAAAGVAEQVMEQMEPTIKTRAFISSVAQIQAAFDLVHADQISIDSEDFPCPDPEAAKKMKAYIENMKQDGDSCGGTITCLIEGAPTGLGEPIFDKFEALLAQAMLSLPASKSFEVGSGLVGTTQKGSEHNDPFSIDPKTKRIKTLKNSSGGIQGGISNGEMIYFKVGFKPPSTIFKTQDSVDHDQNKVSYTKKGGRHDPCVLPRAVVIVESMAQIVTLDLILRNKASKMNALR